MRTPALHSRPIAAVLGLFALSLLVPSHSFAAPRSVDPALNHIEPGTAMSDRFLTRGRDGEVLIEMMVEGDVAPGLLRARGIEVNTVTGRWMTARCPLGLLQAFLQMPGIDRVIVADRAKHNLDNSALDVQVYAIRNVPPPAFTGQTGIGVVIGDVDTGIDLGHADFKHTNGTTRRLSLWDQTATGTPPPGFTYGAEYSAAQINAGSAPETDPDQHARVSID